MNRSKQNLSELIEGTIDLIRLQAERKNIEVKSHISSEIPE